MYLMCLNTISTKFWALFKLWTTYSPSFKHMRVNPILSLVNIILTVSVHSVFCSILWSFPNQNKSSACVHKMAVVTETSVFLAAELILSRKYSSLQNQWKDVFLSRVIHVSHVQSFLQLDLVLSSHSVGNYAKHQLKFFI